MAEFAMPAATSATTPEALFTEAYAQYRPMVRSTIIGRLGLYGAPDTHLAEDLTQNTFLALYRQGDRIPEIRNIGGLLRVMARQSVSHHYRLLRNQNEQPTDTGHWQYANREMGATAAGYYTSSPGGFRTATLANGDSDPDADEALRRARQNGGNR